MEHDDKVRNELQRLLDEAMFAVGNGGMAKDEPVNAGSPESAHGSSSVMQGSTRNGNEKDFTKEDRKVLRRMLIRV